MNYNLDCQHLQIDDATDIDFDVILKGMEGNDLWSEFGEEVTVYDAFTPVLIRRQDLDNLLRGALNV